MSHAFPSDIAVHLPDSYRLHMSSYLTLCSCRRCLDQGSSSVSSLQIRPMCCSQQRLQAVHCLSVLLFCSIIL